MDSSSEEITIVKINKTKRKAPEIKSKKKINNKILNNTENDKNIQQIEKSIESFNNNAITNTKNNKDTDIKIVKELSVAEEDIKPLSKQSHTNTLLVCLKQRNLTYEYYVKPSDLINILYKEGIVKAEKKLKYKNVILSKYTSFKNIKFTGGDIIEEVDDKSDNINIRVNIEGDRRIEVEIDRYKKIDEMKNIIIHKCNDESIHNINGNLVIIFNGMVINDECVVDKMLEEKDLIDVVIP
ncbi:hypothetical protein SLOPH_1034 [Spraguea lophii 42_110]|uniref:Ubiquitin-like domain-containing protein n=1 Tax=Spraguea lophii (strain 42_110) TaxID=1358809 RepID=S7XS45_SPRLO|nr:hypothetical protein SLOPH_1034 [Spraguea lophii 42_110]